MRSRSEPPLVVKGFTTRGRAWEWRQSWFLLFFLTYFLYWVPLVYMGLRVLRLRWVFFAMLYAGPAALLAVMLLTAGATREAIHAAAEGGAADAALAAHAGAIRYMWYSTNAFLVFALCHTWLAREEFLMRLVDQADERDDLAERTLAKVEMEATATRPPATPKRLLQVNTVSEVELAMLPGFGPELARRAVTLRNDAPFKSLEDFRFRLNLPVDVMIKLSPLVSVISMSTKPGGGTEKRTGGRIVDV